MSDFNYYKVNDKRKLEYTVNENDCWVVKDEYFNKSGKLSCKLIYKNKVYRSVIRYIYAKTNDINLDSSLKIKKRCDNKKCINPDHMFIYKEGDWRTLIVGKKYGRLTVCELKNNKDIKEYKVECICDCGNKIRLSMKNLLAGTKSCGCLNVEKIGNLNKSHQKSKTRLYKIFFGAKQRCYNKNNPKYKHYGGRGIGMCSEWLCDFMNFYEWAMKNGYNEELTLDRIDIDGNYEPSNCRWITNAKQQTNKQNSIKVNYKGIEYGLRELTIKLGCLNKYNVIKWRMLECGFSFEEALNVKSKQEVKLLRCKLLLINNGFYNNSIKVSVLIDLLSEIYKRISYKYIESEDFINMLNEIKLEVVYDIKSNCGDK